MQASIALTQPAIRPAAAAVTALASKRGSDSETPGATQWPPVYLTRQWNNWLQ
jgi:hypothetical protein